MVRGLAAATPLTSRVLVAWQPQRGPVLSLGLPAVIGTHDHQRDVAGPSRVCCVRECAIGRPERCAEGDRRQGDVHALRTEVDGQRAGDALDQLDRGLTSSVAKPK